MRDTQRLPVDTEERQAGSQRRTLVPILIALCLCESTQVGRSQVRQVYVGFVVVKVLGALDGARDDALVANAGVTTKKLHLLLMQQVEHVEFQPFWLGNQL